MNLDLLTPTTEVRESNNSFWVSAYLKAGWKLLGMFATKEEGVTYVIGWQRGEETPVEADLDKAVEEFRKRQKNKKTASQNDHQSAGVKSS